jgi:hypothetical protein
MLLKHLPASHERGENAAIRSRRRRGEKTGREKKEQVKEVKSRTLSDLDGTT